MSRKFTRIILTASVSVFLLMQGTTLYAAIILSGCPANMQPCNGVCIPETSLCILEPLPGGSSQIPSSAVPLQVFLDYINGSGGSIGVWQWAFRTGVAIAILNAVFGGFQIVLSNGDSGQIDAGKKRFIGSALGLALLFLSGVILNFINPYGFGTPTSPALP